MKSNISILAVLVLTLSACGGTTVGGTPETVQPCTVTQNSQGAQISCPDGTSVEVPFATPGDAGSDGTSCTVHAETNGDVVSCTDGSTVIIHDGANGTNGTNGTNGKSCTVKTNTDGTKTLSCTDGTAVVISDGKNGTNGTSCTVKTNLDGTKTVSCTDGTSVTLSNGTNGTNGTNGKSCTVTNNGNGTVTVSCTDGTSATVANGTNGTNGINGTNGTNGTNGSSCSAVNNGNGTSTITCTNGTSSTISNGTNGTNGTNGSNGTNGANGTNGSNGTNGYNSLILTGQELAGTNCPFGGTFTKVGQDLNRNGILDPAEVTSTSYNCNASELNTTNQCNGDFVADSLLDLALLQQCEAVTGSITISTTHISGRIYLPLLKHVGANLIIDNSDLVTSISIPNLESVEGSFFIAGMDGLTDMGQMDHLQYVAGTTNVATATTTAMGLVIIYDPLLTKLPNFNALYDCTGALRITNDVKITSISGFPNLTSVGYLNQLGDGFSVNLTNLASITGFQQLNTVSNFVLTNNPKLTTVTGFAPAIQYIGPVGNVLYIKNNLVLPQCIVDALRARFTLTHGCNYIDITNNDDPCVPDPCTGGKTCVKNCSLPFYYQCN